MKDYSEHFKAMSSEELQQMVDNKDQYTKEVLDEVYKEVARRKGSSQSSTNNTNHQKSAPVFDVSDFDKITKSNNNSFVSNGIKNNSSAAPIIIFKILSGIVLATSIFGLISSFATYRDFQFYWMQLFYGALNILYLIGSISVFTNKKLGIYSMTVYVGATIASIISSIFSTVYTGDFPFWIFSRFYFYLIPIGFQILLLNEDVQDKFQVKRNEIIKIELIAAMIIASIYIISMFTGLYGFMF